MNFAFGKAYAKKVGEEVIDSRNTWKIETNNGILWVDTFYGIPLKVDSGGNIYKFEQLAVNIACRILMLSLLNFYFNGSKFFSTTTKGLFPGSAASTSISLKFLAR